MVINLWSTFTGQLHLVTFAAKGLAYNQQAHGTISRQASGMEPRVISLDLHVRPVSSHFHSISQASEVEDLHSVLSSIPWIGNAHDLCAAGGNHWLAVTFLACQILKT